MLNFDKEIASNNLQKQVKLEIGKYGPFKEKNKTKQKLSLKKTGWQMWQMY